MIKTEGFIEREIEPEKNKTDKPFISAVTLMSIDGKELKTGINLIKTTLENSINKIHRYDDNKTIAKCLDRIKNRYSEYNCIEYYGIGEKHITIYCVFKNEQNENILIFGRFHIDKNNDMDYMYENLYYPEELNTFKE